jgi:energy-converting hydrogenase Eha subunit G
MQKALLILGALMVVAGLLVASGMMKYQDKDKVVDFGSLEIEATQEKEAPLNWGYLLLGVGAVALVGGAMMRRP